MVEVELSAVRVDLQSNNPVVLLQETAGNRRTLPIFVGTAEATAIASALQGVTTPRPMTHDLLRDVLEAFGAILERVVITELRSTTYFADLHLLASERRSTVSSRPSDAIALAARVGAPLFVADEVLDAEGVVLRADQDGEAVNPEELVDQFQEFLRDVRPEDFQS